MSVQPALILCQFTYNEFCLIFNLLCTETSHCRFSVEWIDSEFEESGTIDPYKHPLLSETEIIFLDGLNRRSKLGVLPKRPSINDYEKLQAAYKVKVM